MSRSEACSPPAASIAAMEPTSRPGRCFAPEGTNWPSLSSHSLPNPSASMKPVRTETPAWEISDWGETDRNGGEHTTILLHRYADVGISIERVLPRSANNDLDNHYFPSSEHPFPD